MLKGMSPEMKAKLGLGLAKDYSYLTMVSLQLCLRLFIHRLVYMKSSLSRSGVNKIESWIEPADLCHSLSRVTALHVTVVTT